MRGRGAGGDPGDRASWRPRPGGVAGFGLLLLLPEALAGAGGTLILTGRFPPRPGPETSAEPRQSSGRLAPAAVLPFGARASRGGLGRRALSAWGLGAAASLGRAAPPVSCCGTFEGPARSAAPPCTARRDTEGALPSDPERTGGGPGAEPDAASGALSENFGWSRDPGAPEMSSPALGRGTYELNKCASEPGQSSFVSSLKAISHLCIY